LIFFKKDKIQSGLFKRENNSDSELNLENELNKNMQKIINGNLSPTFGPTTQKHYFLEHYFQKVLKIYSHVLYRKNTGPYITIKQA
jgi:hypothetical protein